MTMSLSSTVCTCIDTSGVRNSLSPFTGDANFTPSSLILRISPRLQTWKPPESVRIGLVQASKRCSPPNCLSTSSPGRIHKWKVLPRMIWAPISSSERGVTPLTVPYVPTGMKMGVCTTPWFSVRRPRRAWPSVLRSSNESMGGSGGPVQEHRIAVAEEAIALRDGMAVQVHDAIVAREGADQHHEGGTGQVEV